MKESRLFAAGSYTALGGPGIRVFSLENDRLTALYDVALDDPVWLETAPGGGHLYAACGGEGPAEGYIAALAPLAGDWRKGMALEARRAAHGVCPCHLCLAGGDLISANYFDGSISVFPLEGGIPGEMSQSIAHRGKGALPERQAGPHVHQALPLGENRFLAQDLGLDAMVLYEKREGAWRKTAETRLPPGDGPRHAHLDGETLYLATELSSLLRVFSLQGDSFVQRQALPLPEEGYPFPNYPAAIRPAGGDLLAVSCRGADETVFFRKGPDGRLAPAGRAPVHGCWPRDILPLEGGRLLCANQKSGDVTLLRCREGHTAVLDALRFPAPVALTALA